MSVFGKALASLGVGAAKVDTRLEKATYRQGEMIRGEVFIQGGQAPQLIEEIYLYLIVQYHHEGTQKEYVVSEFRLTEAFEIGPHESKVLPFQFEMPFDAPVSTGGSPIYLKTGLDIKMAMDPSDTDGVEILPHPLIDAVLHALEGIGFRLSSVDYAFDKFYSRHPFIQEYKMIPEEGAYREAFDQISLVFYPHVHEVDVILSLDRKAIDLMSSMEEALNLDERILRFTVTKKEVERGPRALEAKMAQLIDPYL
jgi:sporulation-control protein